MLCHPRRIIRATVRLFIRVLRSLKYTHLTNQSSSKSTYVANLLVVKKPVYAKVAKICAESFYFSNPKCKVVIHVDSFTEKAVKKSLKRLIKLGVVEIRNLNMDSLSWQELKLELVLSMKDQSEFFMDADLRWNGRIPELSSITYFVNEFNFADKSPYAELIQASNWKYGQSISMKNTSFVAWASYRITEEDRLLVQNVMEYMNQTCLIENQFPEHQASLSRISEQIALSILAEKISEKITYLKSKDGYRDGTFVESSYFGATGSTF